MEVVLNEEGDAPESLPPPPPPTVIQVETPLPELSETQLRGIARELVNEQVGLLSENQEIIRRLTSLEEASAENRTLLLSVKESVETTVGAMTQLLTLLTTEEVLEEVATTALEKQEEKHTPKGFLSHLL